MSSKIMDFALEGEFVEAADGTVGLVHGQRGNPIFGMITVVEWSGFGRSGTEHTFMAEHDQSGRVMMIETVDPTIAVDPEIFRVARVLDVRQVLQPRFDCSTLDPMRHTATLVCKKHGRRLRVYCDRAGGFPAFAVEYRDLVL
ncbi:hypothetical protein [Thalassospira lohafexi]|uniref:Uncharacterized protein n=1 Tax=Thalassospira lohafexi TaxID=744227 RepID=A0A2N3L3U7_9PROT|nr:hypothetical protein [Thalassospira lohafexi]PKR57485.1 hypothetical protein COO92_16215 [Thalassospira lohafexi]